MMKTTLHALFASLLLATSAAAQDERTAEWSGEWFGEVLTAGRVEPASVHARIAPEGDGVHARLAVQGDEFLLEGAHDPEERTLRLVHAAPDAEVTLVVSVHADSLTGTLEHSSIGSTPIVLTRNAPPAVERLVVDFSIERPRTVEAEGLDTALTADLDERLARFVADRRVVGLSAAVVVDGALVDVRSYGWEDHHGGVAATGETRYRWASISKPVTAVAALQLAETGRLDLDGDVRALVPEYDKDAVITARQLLCHQGGVTHYRDMRVRRPRTYDVAHPWSDRILAMDLFVDTDLVHEPGTRYLYTTAGYVVLGAVVERAGGERYDRQVHERISRPLGMSTMQPDYPGASIPHRSRGYRQDGDETIDSGDNDVSWKLPGGGFISTVGDLARFGAGLMGAELLGLEMQVEMWTPQITATGARTDYGLGVVVGELAGFKTVGHSGGQLKTSTFLLVLPEQELAVALMCNTQGTGLGDLAREVLGGLVEAQDG